MLASLADAPLEDPRLVYEPKYDGIRAIAEVTPRNHARLWSRLGNEKTHQFPEIAGALNEWARALKHPVVIDGEIVALDARGEPTGFQELQGRIHVSDKAGREPFSTGRSEQDSRRSRPVAFIAFDLLREGARDLRDWPLVERRAALERLFGRAGSSILRVSEMVRADGRALYKRALAHGWEGLIAKQADSKYKSGKRTPEWRKLKIVREQEFVIGGWTEPRRTRAYFGALLLGVYERGPKSQISNPKSLVYIGHAGTGFNERELVRLMKLLKPIETGQCPFRERPQTNEKPHWVRPTLVAQIKFAEWTADGKLRHPVYLGLRDDKKPEEIVREPETRLHAKSERAQGSGFEVQGSERVNPEPRTQNSLNPDPRTENPEPRDLVEQLREIERSRRDGVLTLADGDRLNVTNLHKVFWPKQKLTKGDLFRYYAQIAPYILPAVAGRPLVMKRFPDGVRGQPFYQHQVRDVPSGVRVEMVGVAPGGRRPRNSHVRRPHLIGGNLKTLLYMTQLAAISQDPWFSRIQTIQYADHAAIDLDPAAGVTFDRVLDVARFIRDELEAVGVTGIPKTSGASGLHIYIPLPPGTPHDTGRLFCQIIATVVAAKHHKIATVERAVRARGRRVYVDCLQNILGKTLATAYSARASDYAGVSTPLSWQEIENGVRREDFTIDTVLARVRRVGDLWAPLRESEGVDLARVVGYANEMGKRRSKADRL